MSKKRFRIAFSFAGEKRRFVGKVATLLAKRFGPAAILYDKYHEAEFARRDLGVYLPGLYHKKSDLVVVVVCPAYDTNQWTGLEWMAILDLLKKRKDEEVMLCRFDCAGVSGLYSNAGFVELDDKTPKQTASLILERLALNEGKPRDFYATNGSKSSKAPSATIPNNLPHLESFFGRAEELKRIKKALDHRSGTWGVLIDGPGGMGKTSLALRAALDCTPEQFDRIVFLSRKHRELDDDGERELGPFILSGFLEMLNELAQELNRSDILKARESERIPLILRALRSARVLLILDNLESLTRGDRDKLLTFVKRLPSGCKAILTSRERFAVFDPLILKELTEQAALETLADIARHNPLLAQTSTDERITLYRETGGRPLLLRWTAGQLGRGSYRTIAGALAFLRTCPDDNDPLEFIFGDLTNDFTQDETKVLAALTFFTQPAKVEHIAIVAQSEQKSAIAALHSLANRALIVPDKDGTSFSLMPMVGDFLRKKRREAIATTGTRLERRAYSLIAQNANENYRHFAVLDKAWPTVGPALPLFIAGPNRRLQTVCDALRFFLEFTGRWDEWISLYQQAEEKAVAHRGYYDAGWLSYFSGWAYCLRRQKNRVFECADRAREHWNAASAGAREQAFAVQLRGHGYRLQKDYSSAIQDYRVALRLHRTVFLESEDVALVLNALACVQHESKNLAAARLNYCKALKMARGVDDSDGVARYTANLSQLALDQKRWVKGEVLAREALAVCELTGRQQSIADSLHCLAFALLRQRKKPEALTHARRAVDIYSHLGALELTSARKTLRACER